MLLLTDVLGHTAECTCRLHGFHPNHPSDGRGQTVIQATGSRAHPSLARLHLPHARGVTRPWGSPSELRHIPALTSLPVYKALLLQPSGLPRPSWPPPSIPLLCSPGAIGPAGSPRCHFAPWLYVNPCFLWICFSPKEK